MDAYIDSSGCEGFKFGPSDNPTSPKYGSSRCYVVAALLVLEVGPIIERVNEIRGQLDMEPDHEFHFSELKRDRRFAFLAALDSYDFEIHALVVRKKLVWSPILRGDGIMFRQFFLKQILRTDRTPLSKSLVVIDQIDNDEQKQEAARRYLLREVNAGLPADSPRVSHLEFRPSHLDAMVQAADMCAGAIRWAHERQSREYRRLIEDRIRNEWFFG